MLNRVPILLAIIVLLPLSSAQAEVSTEQARKLACESIRANHLLTFANGKKSARATLDEFSGHYRKSDALIARLIKQVVPQTKQLKAAFDAIPVSATQSIQRNAVERNAFNKLKEAITSFGVPEDGVWLLGKCELIADPCVDMLVNYQADFVKPYVKVSVELFNTFERRHRPHYYKPFSTVELDLLSGEVTHDKTYARFLEAPKILKMNEKQYLEANMTKEEREVCSMKPLSETAVSTSSASGKTQASVGVPSGASSIGAKSAH